MAVFLLLEIKSKNHFSRQSNTSSGASTRGPVYNEFGYNEFGYNEHLPTTSLLVTLSLGGFVQY